MEKQSECPLWGYLPSGSTEAIFIKVIPIRNIKMLKHSFIKNGESTQSQLHAITPVTFKATNKIVSQIQIRKRPLIFLAIFSLISIIPNLCEIWKNGLKAPCGDGVSGLILIQALFLTL